MGLCVERIKENELRNKTFAAAVKAVVEEKKRYLEKGNVAALPDRLVARLAMNGACSAVNIAYFTAMGRAQDAGPKIAEKWGLAFVLPDDIESGLNAWEYLWLEDDVGYFIDKYKYESLAVELTLWTGDFKYVNGGLSEEELYAALADFVHARATELYKARAPKDWKAVPGANKEVVKSIAWDEEPGYLYPL